MELFDKLPVLPEISEEYQFAADRTRPRKIFEMMSQRRIKAR